jgi:hypothetical protein
VFFPALLDFRPEGLSNWPLNKAVKVDFLTNKFKNSEVGSVCPNIHEKNSAA